MGVTFAIFYLALRFTPFSRYSKAVNSALQAWYSKRYVVYSLVCSMVVLLTLIILGEIGYANHSDKVVSIKDLSAAESVGIINSKMTASLNALLGHRYSVIDSLAITIASVDKTLGGHYLQSISFILAEDIEILIFMIVVKKTGQRGIFRSRIESESEIPSDRS